MPEELLNSGPAGTGKTRGNLEFINEIAKTYDGARILMARKTRASLTQSVMQSFEQFVLPRNNYSVPFRSTEQEYRYPNGSRIVVAGFDKPSKLMSSEYDIAFLPEATELEENDLEMATTRLRYGRVPFQAALLECNPSAPSHWLKKRCESGRMKMDNSNHWDNPLLYDWLAGQWTAKGLAYLQKLNNLTGARRLRFLFGLWAASEGAVYEGWNPALHIINRFDIPPDWERYLSIDFGFTNAFVCQWWAADEDQRLYLYREMVSTKRLVEDWAGLIKSQPDFDKINLIVTDHDAEDRATLDKHLERYSQPAVKDISPGIQAMAARLKRAGDGRPRLFVMRDALITRDADMDEDKKPQGLAEEIDGYTWAIKPKQGISEMPVSVDNHSLDAARYMVAYMDMIGGGAFTMGGIV